MNTNTEITTAPETTVAETTVSVITVSETTAPKKTLRKKVTKSDPVCIICDEKYNKTVHLPIKCMYCDFEACRKCCETYILQEPIVKCMNLDCGREWTRKFIRDIFTLTFITKPLKTHREDVLFDKERALLPATQPIVENKLEVVRINAEIERIQNLILPLRQQINDLEMKKVAILRKPNRSIERSLFVRACPDGDCRGFLSTQWKCGICTKWTCPDCHVIKGFERDVPHTCNPDDLATAQLLANDTKPCPKCHTGIFKIDGCDQMWCTQCHTAFSWRTGTIQNNIHNPHYYEWLRRNNDGQIPRNPGDLPCGRERELNHRLLNDFTRGLNKHKNSVHYSKCTRGIPIIMRNTIHLVNVEMPPQVNYETKNEDLRVKYLMKEITEEDFKNLLQKNDKKQHKQQEIRDIFQIVSNTVTDILFRFLDHLETAEKDKFNMKIFKEIIPIISYANECLVDVSRTYTSKLIQFNNFVALRRNIPAGTTVINNNPNEHDFD
jgi:hypothetical protein